jgi:hypothetical protein
MQDLYLFEIPIYRCAVEKHTQELDAAKASFLKPVFGQHAPESRQANEAYFDREHWYSWRYNEIVGWIEIFILGTQVRGELWLIKQRVTKSVRQKQFRRLGKLFEYNCFLPRDQALGGWQNRRGVGRSYPTVRIGGLLGPNKHFLGTPTSHLPHTTELRLPAHRVSRSRTGVASIAANCRNPPCFARGRVIQLVTREEYAALSSKSPEALAAARCLDRMQPHIL